MSLSGHERSLAEICCNIVVICYLTFIVFVPIGKVRAEASAGVCGRENGTCPDTETTSR